MGILLEWPRKKADLATLVSQVSAVEQKAFSKGGILGATFPTGPRGALLGPRLSTWLWNSSAGAPSRPAWGRYVRSGTEAAMPSLACIPDILNSGG